MPQRRANDTQTERLLAALQSLPYRQELARKIAKREGIKYDSAMRRLQRYTTTASERRSFVGAPVAVQRATRQIARRIPLPVDFISPPRPLPPPAPIRRPVQMDWLRPIPPHPTKPPRRAPVKTPITQYDYPAIKAYFDGDENEAIEALDLQRRRARGMMINEPDIFRLAAQLVDVSEVEGADTIADKIRAFYRELDPADLEDIQDFTALLFNLPDWQIGMILQDMEEGDTTFADWLDAWRDDGMDLDAEDSEYWQLWRAAYARAKGK